MDTYHCDTATPADIPALVDLLAKLFALEPQYTIDPTRQARGLAILMSAPERGTILCARSSGTPVAMVSLQLVASTAEGAWSAWLEDLVVHPAHRGKGLGTRLLTTARGWCHHHGATRIQALVDRDNLAALEFYHTRCFNAGRMVSIHSHLEPRLL